MTDSETPQIQFDDTARKPCTLGQWSRDHSRYAHVNVLELAKGDLRLEWWSFFGCHPARVLFSDSAGV
ncbi:hypothetical protein FRAHR75_160014 [Frankia sp. Hr75.2]|nr:hypothetical protein FRAHR75_160014 [Frankia sp. Hr75.2]